jgi:broad specificity phosphatase PhoE
VTSTARRPLELLLVRHGTTPTTGKVLPGRAPGLHLAELGQAQAEAVAARLVAATPPVTAIYASPLERAQETAAPLAAAQGLAVITDERLHETDVGAWTGMPLNRVVRKREWRGLLARAGDFTFPEGESVQGMRERMRSFAIEMASRHPGERICAFSHADPIKTVVLDALGMGLDGLHRVEIHTASITSVLVGPALSLRLLNLEVWPRERAL